MIEYIRYGIPVIFLILLSLIDIKTFNLKHGAIPSVITTLFLIVSFAITLNPVTIIYSFLLGLFFVDIDFFTGIPDWKVIVACGCVLPNIFLITVFGFVAATIGTVYKYFGRKTTYQELPFIPVFTLAYLCMIGVIIL